MDENERKAQHQNALDRQRNSHELARQRAIDAEVRRANRVTEAQLGELDAMRLKHDQDLENRGRDHEFNRAEDARELERLATETALRRRDDAVRKAWSDNERLQLLEADILRIIANHKVTAREEEQRHGHSMAEKAADQRNLLDLTQTNHGNAKEMAILANELDKDNFEFKERLMSEIRRAAQGHSEEEIARVLQKIHALD